VKSMQTIFPRLKLRTISHAGHWVHADSPDIFYEVVTEFLSA